MVFNARIYNWVTQIYLTSYFWWCNFIPKFHIMLNNSVSRYVQQNWGKVVYITIMLVSIPLMIIPIIKSFFSGFHYLMALGGIILFFYGLLNLVHKSIFYIILGTIFFLLLIFELKGDDIFNIKLLSYLGEDIAFSVGFFLFAAIIACIIGIARWRKHN